MKESSKDKGMKQYTLNKVVFLAHHEDSKDKQPSSLLLAKNKLFYNKEKTPIICLYSKKTWIIETGVRMPDEKKIVQGQCPNSLKTNYIVGTS